MRTYFYKILIVCFGLFVSLGVNAQAVLTTDSVLSESDSLIHVLRTQVQELQLQRIMMQERLAETGRGDSVRKAERMARIDSLRTITPGAPLVIEGDTLLVLYARKGGVLAEKRVEQAYHIILSQGKRMTMFADSVYVYESDFFSDIMAGNDVILSVTDLDGLWQNTTRQELAAKYAEVIKTKIVEIHEEYGLRQKLYGLMWVAIIIVVQTLLIRFTLWLYRRWRYRLLRRVMRWDIPLRIRDYEVLNVRRRGLLFLFFYRLLRIFLILIQLLISVPLLFYVFPETKTFTFTILGYIWNPFVDIVMSVIGYLPNLFKIIVIIICFRYIVKAIRYLLNEVATGKLKINGFYADWAQPTFLILRLLLYSFMFVMIWPLLPSSNSEIFQGVSVFIGVIVSLGSTSIVGNVMAGLVMTYMRPFKEGDFIRFGEVEGFVLEKTALVTRVRTRKNEVITIPNSNLMSAQTSNFTFAAENFGIIVHTKVTIGYDMKHELIENLLLASAKATHHLLQKPLPYVRVTALDDFYVEYEINAFTHSTDKLSDIYSELHQNILDHFHEAGVEIMSPHIFAHRDNLELQIPKNEK
ncbi:mechanosensitive ion channel family protein [Prevotella sp. E2-28]|uniref:mechanosensitive ion channel family protein n=1 Tax=Prevotella sp. E2-28 TaxID=2913620 RepID=UPI001EDC1533|nr:mechanosensitive ion channel domain-containing protein [Prevotella sp. E2-28]UKK52609.1 mechanosensitive ion channel family protein [Prevotella sp. E2-28]